MAQKFFVTTPIYYVNARPHIGHAYTTIVADVLARRARAQDIPTFFLTGTDEHGQKIERSALAAGVPPQQFTDDVSAAFQTLWKRMGITNDAFIRTTSDAHKRGAQKLFRDLFDRGHIHLSSYTGQYSIGEEMFVEGPPGTIGPDGKPTETVTEENFFFRLSDLQLPLLDLIESDTLRITPESRKNEVLSFLRGNVASARPSAELGAPGLASETWAEPPQPPTESAAPESSAPFVSESHPAMSGSAATSDSPLPRSALGHPYLPGALKDLSVSRSSFTWGIPVPPDIQQAAGAQNPHVIYVWLDALANYMTAVGFGDPARTADFETWWPADLHLVGKEIIRFHCVYWPAFLLALNPALAHAPAEPTPILSLEAHRKWAEAWLPQAVTAHGWLLFDDSKMSKSKGNIVRTETILEAFGTLCPPPPSAGTATTPGASGLASETWVLPTPEPTPHDRDLFATDVLRYFLLREIPFGQDGSFTFEALITRYNADLANGYGNLVSRTLKMIQDNFSGETPVDPTLALAANADELAFFASNGPAAQVVQHVNRCVSISTNKALSTALNAFLGELNLAITVTDKYISENAPWKLAKTPGAAPREKLNDVLAAAAESIRIITALLYPILPYATAAVWRQLGLGDIEAAARNGELTNLQWGGLQPGTKLGPLSPIFPRADKRLAETMTQMEQDKSLGHITTQADAGTDTQNDFPVSSLASEVVTSPVEDHAPFDPAAGPRTSTLTEPNPGATVAGSSALTTGRPGTPPHSEAPTSGIFNTPGAPGLASETWAGPAPSSPEGTTSSAPQPAQPTDASPQITIDDFAKIELRVAQVLVAERIPKADKLLRLEVDLGYERRQILSGIAEWYTPEDLVGRRIVVVTNLAPRKMRGLESHGMLLAASTEGGKPHLATFDAAADTLPLGSRLK